MEAGAEVSEVEACGVIWAFGGIIAIEDEVPEVLLWAMQSGDIPAAPAFGDWCGVVHVATAGCEEWLSG